MGRKLFLIGLVLAFAFNLRTNLANFPPVVSFMRADFEVAPLAVSVLGFVPPFAFAIAGPLAQVITGALGTLRTAQLAVLLIAVGTVARGLAPNLEVFVVGTALALGGAGLGNVLLPGLTRRVSGRFLSYVSMGSGTVFAVATAVPVFVAAPIAGVLGWQWSFLVWGFVAFVTWGAWVYWGKEIAAGVGSRAPSFRSLEHIALQVRRPEAWLNAAIFGLSGFIVYSVFAWFPLMMQSVLGVSSTFAGGALGLFAGSGVGIYVIMWFGALARWRPTTLMLLGFLLFLVFLGACLIVNPANLLWWFVVGGLGPMVFPIVLLGIARQVGSSDADVGFSAFVQGTGYLLGASGPLVIGYAYSVTGGWVVPIAILAGAAIIGCGLTIALRRTSAVDKEPI